MERLMYNRKLSYIINFKDKHERISMFSLKHKYDVVKLIIKIHNMFGNKKISSFDYDAFGEGYEKYTADEVMKAKSWGQYFTRRDVIDIIVNEIKPSYNQKGSDETCGTGGFLLGFYKHVKNTLDEQLNKKEITQKEYNKRLERFSKNIYGNELVWKVFKPLILNLQCKNICIADDENEHIRFGSCMDKSNLRNGEVYDFMAGNPPFGMSIKWENYMNNILQVKVKNSVGLILQLYLYKLKTGGKCGLVIDRGILNNGTDKKNAWEKNVRKLLINTGGLYKIILLPTGIFAHTNFATAIIFFEKGKMSASIEFVEGYFKPEDKGTGNKTLYFKDGIIVDINKIRERNYSLKLEDYIEKQNEIRKGQLI